ncbi:hypothetical protein [Oleiagrimonas soli]|uniref:PgaA membrane beta barrel domain-containing protein n=1 Tax=Oleiagrimonas soli TaxID=1543381 RepID=A0A099D1C0_9GAMM|nr:hypothetical protein [Oleiagrimonas soli]KGI79080.1 hypothetical protein LF63_0100900 [Oleiagrimonas soli]MBB6184712.1 hypothetical protein [Oleiagrimonas soli]
MAQMTHRRRASARAAALGRATLLTAFALACTLPLTAVRAQSAVPYQPALSAAWDGHTAKALRLIDVYLAAHPNDHAAQLDRARFLAWMGAYAKADDALAKFGANDQEALALRARVLAWAERRHAALAINAPLYAADPSDDDNAWTQALILRQGEWPQQALPALATVQADKPDDKDTNDLAKAVRLPLFSWVGLTPSLYSDSDHIEIRTLDLDSSLWLADRWRLLADVTRRRHSAPFGGPFAPLLGDNHVDEDRIGSGLRFAPSPDIALELWLGNSRIDNGRGGENETIGHLLFSQYASDAFRYTITADRDRVDASPRALTVMRNGLAVDLSWTPTLRDRIDAHIAHDDFDDDNRRASALVSYARAVYRGERATLDLGVQGETQHNSLNTDNGYYSPDRYRRYAFTASSYISISDEVGLSLSTALGQQRDETFSQWKRAFDISGALTVGIFTHWQLVGRAGYSQRLNQFGRYIGSNVGLELRYRFCEFRADRCPSVR